MNTIFLNIETCPPNGTRPDPSRVQVPVNYKDPEKISAYQLEHAVKDWRNLSTSLPFAKICCITWAVGDEEPRYLIWPDEDKLVRQFEAELGEPRPIEWVTFNGLKFDHPILRARAVRYGCSHLASQMATRRYGDQFHVDIFQRLGGEGRLDEWCQSFGIELDNPITGAGVLDALVREQYDLVVRHSVSRIIGTRAIYNLLVRHASL